MPDYLSNLSAGTAQDISTQPSNPPQSPAGQYEYDPLDFANQSAINRASALGVQVDPSLSGFLPNRDVVQEAYERMLTDKDAYKQSFGLGISNMQNQYGNQISQMTGGQGLMSMMGSGFGSKSRGIVKNIGDVRSAYSSDMAGGLLSFQNQMRSADYKYEDAGRDYDNSLIDRLIQLERLYGEDNPDYITFT
tara:strand:+ start:2309 stop:2884 length:576 start_codon:yes stop_codon:yes gene_type:complete